MEEPRRYWQENHLREFQRLGVNMYEFTKAEIERINQLYGTDFKDITPDDAMLIGRFEANKALQKDEHRAKLEAIQAESENRMRICEEEHKQAMGNLKALQAKALARLERVENGK